MAGPRLLIVFAIFTLSSFSQLSAAEQYVGGPLPNVLLKKSHNQMKQILVRQQASPPPCFVCCQQQRNVERLRQEARDDREEFDRENQALATAVEELDQRREALTAVARQIGNIQRSILVRRAQISVLDTQLTFGFLSPNERQRLRAQKERLRRQIDAIRRRIQTARDNSRRLARFVEQAVAVVTFRRVDRTDAKQVLDRAARRRDNAQESLDNCRAERAP